MSTSESSQSMFLLDWLEHFDLNAIFLIENWKLKITQNSLYDMNKIFYNKIIILMFDIMQD